MKTIDIKKVVYDADLNFNDVAGHLFPDNKHARLALNRVISGDSSLNTEQISKLALLSGLSISQLFGETGWSTRAKSGVYTLTCAEFTATLDMSNWVTKIFHKDSLFHDAVLSAPNTPLSEYIELLNNQIINYKKK